MNCADRLRPALLALLGGMMLVSCGSPQRTTSESAPANLPPNAVQSSLSSSIANQPGVDRAKDTVLPDAAATQLIKTAKLQMRVDSVEASLKAATTIAHQQQGEMLGLNDSIPAQGDTRMASLQLRVPQSKLDTTIANLSKLGIVENQSQTAEDVSSQLVDYQARLRNLRKAEATVLKIMDRSGNVGDVLKVVKELNTIRGEIEQINGQLSDLQNSVTYSTIDLTLMESIAITPPLPATTTQLQNAWKGATRSIGEVTVDLLQIGIWLMVYSPYLLVLAGIAWAGYSRFRRWAKPGQRPSASRSVSTSSEAAD